MMKKKLLGFTLFSLLLCCNTDDNCGEIIDKVTTENRFLLVIRFDDGATTSQTDFSGELVSDIEVNEETFARVQEGENYCIE